MQNNWSESELVLALRLYYQTPFGRMHKTNKDIINLSKVIHRTPSAVAMKLSNFARFDTKLINRNIKGLANGSKLDKIIWDKYLDLNVLEESSDKIITHLNSNEVVGLFSADEVLIQASTTKGRKKQSFFRKIVMSNYDFKCCITGFSCSPLLVASHIIPWSKNESTRLDPANGLLLNSIHDKAFDQGLITLDSEYRIVLSEIIKNSPPSEFLDNNFFKFEKKQIITPDKYLPNLQYIKYHNENIFKAYVDESKVTHEIL